MCFIFCFILEFIVSDLYGSLSMSDKLLFCYYIGTMIPAVARLGFKDRRGDLNTIFKCR